jgi:hypothetical protein
VEQEDHELEASLGKVIKAWSKKQTTERHSIKKKKNYKKSDVLKTILYLTTLKSKITVFYYEVNKCC